MKTTQLFFSLLFCLLLFEKSHGQTYHILSDKEYSSISSAEFLNTVHQILTSAEQSFLPDTIGKNIKSRFGKKLANIGYRAGKLFFVEIPVDGFLLTAQYTFFGYGYRYRTSGFIQNRYRINPPIPFGSGGGSVLRGFPENPRTRSRHERIIFHSGRIESLKVFNHTITEKWLLTDSIPFREALLAVRNFNKSHYTILNFTDFTSPSYDLQYYLSEVNSFYGLVTTEDWKIRTKRLRRMSLLNFINPFVGLAFLTSLDYGWRGKAVGKMRWFKFGKIRYLPSLRLGLTPFGDELYFESYFKRNNQALKFYYRRGNPAYEESHGFGIKTFNLFNFSGNIKLNFQIDIWSQPTLEIGGEVIRFSSRGLGNLLKCNFQFKILEKTRPLYISGQLGYKTDGYIEGEPLGKGLIFRYGLAYDL